MNKVVNINNPTTTPKHKKQNFMHQNREYGDKDLPKGKEEGGKKGEGKRRKKKKMKKNKEKKRKTYLVAHTKPT